MSGNTTKLVVENLMTRDFWVGLGTRIEPKGSLVFNENALSAEVVANLRAAELVNIIKVTNISEYEQDLPIIVDVHTLSQSDNDFRLHLIAGYRSSLYLMPDQLQVGFRCNIKNDQEWPVPVVLGPGVTSVPLVPIIPPGSTVDLVITRPNRMMLAVPSGTISHGGDEVIEWTANGW